MSHMGRNTIMFGLKTVQFTSEEMKPVQSKSLKILMTSTCCKSIVKILYSSQIQYGYLENLPKRSWTTNQNTLILSKHIKQ